jgi:hypothetical protein
MYQNSVLPGINYPLLKKELSNYSTQCPVSHEFHTFWYCVNIEPVSQTFSYVLCSNSGSFLIFMCVHYSAKYSMVACEDHWGSLSCSVISSALSCNVYFPWFYLTSSFSTSSQGIMVGTAPVSSPGVVSWIPGHNRELGHWEGFLHCWSDFICLSPFSQKLFKVFCLLYFHLHLVGTKISTLYSPLDR